MNKEEKTFADCLGSFNCLEDQLVELSELIKKTEEKKFRAADQLLKSIKYEIIEKCSAEFVSAMKQEVSKYLQSLNGLDSKTTNLDYLAEVIFIPVTGSSEQFGPGYFGAPGDSRQQSIEFCRAYAKDFTRIGELFGVEVREASIAGVNIAYNVRLKRKLSPVS